MRRGGRRRTGTTGATGATGATGIAHPTGADEVVLRVAYEGGFVPYEYTLSSVPSWSLFGDGTLIVQGPQIEIYPGPALPNLVAIPISEEGVQAILEAARDAGLMDGDATYGNDCIADAGDHGLHDERGRPDVGRVRVRARCRRAARNLWRRG